MATCPHCGRVLRITDWKPECPDCGVNLNYYKANDRLLDESEKVEIEHAKFQPKVDRAKAAYAGSWKAILRIVLTLLPVGALIAFLIAVKAPAYMEKYENPSAGIGAYIYILLQAVSFGWNLHVVLSGIPVKYTQCLIGGLPSEEYFGYVEDGWSKEDIRRKMLVALAKLQIEAEAGAETGCEEVRA